MSFRWKGVLALLVIVSLALALLAVAMAFRRVVEQDLDALAAAQAAGAAADAARHLVDARHHTEAATVTLACIAWFGITLIGALSLLFFTRIATDIAAVRARALAIVVGDRGSGPTLLRQDELGELADAVDSLAGALAQRDRDIDIERRHVMHHEKMAAIGAMAAGVLREIGNPIAAIDGYARAMQEARELGVTVLPCEPTDILRETARLAAITHDISELAAVPASQREWTDLNEVVMRTIGLLRYEPRLEGVGIETRLDRQLPAVMGVADRLIQMLMNLLINAADACAGLPPRQARIEVQTRRAADGVELLVADNGCGMSRDVLARAFEPLYTTKPAGLGTGLGLPLVRSIVQDDHGGTIDIDSGPARGTRVCIGLPL